MATRRTDRATTGTDDGPRLTALPTSGATRPSSRRTAPASVSPGLRTKIARPRLPSDHVERARLLRLVDRGLERRLTLVSAPAGCGKTTLLSSWNPPGVTVAWLALDEHDADLAAFARALIGSLQAVAPAVGVSTLSLLGLADRPSPIILAARLADDLADLPNDLVLVLDDYHTVQSDEVHAFVGRLLAGLADNAHLVISGREDPPLPISALRARAELVEIRLEQLAFTRMEAHAFFDNALPAVLDADAVDRLAERSEGWAAGLRLAALAIGAASESATIPLDLEARGGQHAREFLIDDVLAAQPYEIQDLLLRSSILDRFCAPLLDALYVEADQLARGTGWLEALKRGNLFLTPLDADGVWCRFHHLFRDALRRQLVAVSGPERLAMLHRRASDWFVGQSLLREAIKHALAAGDTRHAVRLLEDHLNPLLDREDDPSVLEDCIRMLPAEVTDDDPALLIARAWVLVLRNRPGELPPLLERTAALLDQDDARDDAVRESLRGVVDVFWSYVCGLGADVDRNLASTEAAIRRVPRHWYAARGHAESRHAAALDLSGRSDEAFDWLTDHRFSVTHADASRLGMVLRGQARLDFLHLRFSDLDRVARELAALGQTHGLPSSATWGHFFTGLTRYYWNDLDAARAELLAATADRAHADVRIALDAVLGLAALRQALGDEDGAEEPLHDMATVLKAADCDGPLRILRSFQARLALARGDFDETGRRLRLVRDDAPATFPSFVELPELTRARWLLLQGTPASLNEVADIVRVRREESMLRRHSLTVMAAHALDALLRQARGDVEGALAELRSVVALARRCDLLRWFVDFGSPMQRLLVELERWTAPTDAFVTRVLAAFPATTGPVEAAAPSRREAQASVVDALTWRELEVLQLLDAWMSNKEIARLLHISSETVKKHTGNIYQKLQVGSRREAVSRAHGLGLLRVVPRSSEALPRAVPD